MGIYLNPGNLNFQMALNSRIFVDKSGMMGFLNKIINTKDRFVCVSRPRRFGKSMVAEMLAAYYGKGCDSESQFSGLEIMKSESFHKYLNKYNVIYLTMAEFFKKEKSVRECIKVIEEEIIEELIDEYDFLKNVKNLSLIKALRKVFSDKHESFIFIVDEWDSIFREFPENIKGQGLYLDFLRDLLKDKSYVALAYMTGILPIKKYGKHSALNMFTEYSMIDQKEMAEFTGFTEEEVKALCLEYDMDYEEMKQWYDGYKLRGCSHIYNPKSVVEALTSHYFSNYWTKTETYEALLVYIEMDYDGLRDDITKLLAGEKVKIETGTFVNDMTTFKITDDVLSLLIHLGYLAYDSESCEVFIPNKEISKEFVNAMSVSKWTEVVKSVKESEDLLMATVSGDEEKVAKLIDKAHIAIPSVSYNDENSLASVISIAYYSARDKYIIRREVPAGRGIADVIFEPRKNHPEVPAIIIELQWDKTPESAITQIKNRKYTLEFEREYKGKLIMVGINYNKESKEHECCIESFDI